MVLCYLQISYHRLQVQGFFLAFNVRFFNIQHYPIYFMWGTDRTVEYNLLRAMLPEYLTIFFKIFFKTFRKSVELWWHLEYTMLFVPHDWYTFVKSNEGQIK